MTIAFWTAAGIMTLVALAFVLYPLLISREARGDADRDALNIAIFEERLAELVRARDDGSLSAEEFQRAESELQRELLADNVGVGDTTSDEPAATTGSRRHLVTAVVVALLVPGVAIVSYGQLGSIDHIVVNARSPVQTASTGDLPPSHPPVGEDGGDASLDAMVAALASRLEQSPDDFDGWMMLGRTYLAIQRFPDAFSAFERARQLAPRNPEVLTRYVESMALAQGGRLVGEGERILDQVLAATPENQDALWLKGLAAQQRGAHSEAVGVWEHLSSLLAPQEQGVLTKYLAEAREKAGMTSPAVPSAPPIVAATETPPDEGKTSAPDGEPVSLDVEVTLDPDLAELAQPGDVVFIFARAAEGPRMPLAIVRKTVSELPVQVTLNDSLAMTPAMKLSNFPRVLVGARVSRSGNAIPQEGDLEGLSDSIQAGRQDPVRVTINRRI